MAASPTSQATAQRVLANRDDYYAIFQLGKDCDEQQLVRSYRRLAVELHPDRNKADVAVEAFKVATHAKEVLLDPHKRRIYDEDGAKGIYDFESRGGDSGPSTFVEYISAIFFILLSKAAQPFETHSNLNERLESMRQGDYKPKFQRREYTRRDRQGHLAALVVTLVFLYAACAAFSSSSSSRETRRAPDSYWTLLPTRKAHNIHVTKDLRVPYYTSKVSVEAPVKRPETQRAIERAYYAARAAHCENELAAVVASCMRLGCVEEHEIFASPSASNTTASRPDGSQWPSLKTAKEHRQRMMDRCVFYPTYRNIHKASESATRRHLQSVYHQPDERRQQKQVQGGNDGEPTRVVLLSLEALSEPSPHFRCFGDTTAAPVAPHPLLFQMSLLCFQAALFAG